MDGYDGFFCGRVDGVEGLAFNAGNEFIVDEARYVSKGIADAAREIKRILTGVLDREEEGECSQASGLLVAARLGRFQCGGDRHGVEVYREFSDTCYEDVL